MPRKAKIKRHDLCRCGKDFEVSTVQENGDGMHVIVFVCPDCERTYRLVDWGTADMPTRVVADLMIRATKP